MKRLQLILIGMVIGLCGCSKEAAPVEPLPKAESIEAAAEADEQDAEEIPEPGSAEIPLEEEGEQASDVLMDRYKTILDSNFELIVGGADAYDYIEGSSGIGEVIMNGTEDAVDTIGYSFVDLNGDGEEELVIGAIGEEKEGRYYGQYIYVVYTYRDTPILLLEGWSRNRCYLLEDGTFYVNGSGGAMYRILENLLLDAREPVLITKDYFFTKEKDETFEDIGFYHNTTGDWEASVSEEIEEEAFWDQFQEYEDSTGTLEFTPFSAYPYRDEEMEPEVSIRWITQEELDNDETASFVADESQPQVTAAFYVSEPIRNLKVLSLTFEGVDETDNEVFSTQELHHLGDFEPGNSFAVTLTLYGTIPNYGISYETQEGGTRYYAIGESGMDGSAELISFNK